MSRRVLVTGAASGLGLALARGYVERGDTVLATDLAPEPPAELIDLGPDVTYRRLDVRSEADWSAARDWVVAEWGGLDVLVNNAGIASGGRIDVAEMSEWQRAVDINLLGVVRGCRAFAGLFKRQRSGRVVNIASIAGLVHPAGMASYNAVKAGVVAVSETMRHELAPYSIGVSVVCPSFFRTNLAASLQCSDTEAQSMAAKLIDRSTVTADVVASAVLAGVDKGRFLILPDRDARTAYWTKRLATPAYLRMMAKLGHRIYQREVSTRRTDSTAGGRSTPGWSGA